MSDGSVDHNDHNEPREWQAPDGFSYRTVNKPVKKLWQYGKLACTGHMPKPSEQFPPRTALFRGHREDWPLLPKLGRSDLIPYTAELEQNSIRELKRLCPLLVSHRKAEVLDWLSLGQHNGMATRLLDWTDNALAALWFAVHEIKESSTKPAVVWVLMPWETDYITNKEIADPFNVTKTTVFCPDHSHERVRAQGGWFTLHHFDQISDRFPPLEKQSDFLADSTGTNSKLGRIEIDPRWFRQLRRELDDSGVSAASIYPDLGGVCLRLTELMSHSVRLRADA